MVNNVNLRTGPLIEIELGGVTHTPNTHTHIHTEKYVHEQTNTNKTICTTLLF